MSALRTLRRHHETLRRHHGTRWLRRSALDRDERALAHFQPHGTGLVHKLCSDWAEGDIQRSGVLVRREDDELWSLAARRLIDQPIAADTRGARPEALPKLVLQ